MTIAAIRAAWHAYADGRITKGELQELLNDQLRLRLDTTKGVQDEGDNGQGDGRA